MELTIADLKVWNETLLGLIKELENLSNFTERVVDDTLREIFREQLTSHRQNYEKLRWMLQGKNEAETVSEAWPIVSNGPSQNTPRLELTSSNQSRDRLMAYSHFLACCRGGREFAWNVFDVSSLPLASILETAFRLYVHDASLVKRWLLDRGYYLSQSATNQQIEILQGTFT